MPIKIKLAQALKNRGISKKRFAILTGIGPNNIYRCFKPNYNPRIKDLDKFTEILDCDITDLYEWKAKK